MEDKISRPTTLLLSDSVSNNAVKTIRHIGCFTYLVLICTTTWPVFIFLPQKLAVNITLAYMVTLIIGRTVLYLVRRAKLISELKGELYTSGIEIQPELVKFDIYTPTYRSSGERRIITVTYKFQLPKSKSTPYVTDRFDIITHEYNLDYYLNLINTNSR